MSAAKLTADQARAILGLAPDASPHAVIGAFRAAAKEAHPDLPGGDPARFRDILAAYRLLQSPPPVPAVTPQVEMLPPEPHVEIGPLIAVFGGEAEAVLADGAALARPHPAPARGMARRSHLAARAGEAAHRRRARPAGARLRRLGHRRGGARRARPRRPRQRARRRWARRCCGSAARIAERGLVRLEGQGLPAREGPPARQPLHPPRPRHRCAGKRRPVATAQVRGGLGGVALQIPLIPANAGTQAGLSDGVSARGTSARRRLCSRSHEEHEASKAHQGPLRLRPSAFVLFAVFVFFVLEKRCLRQRPCRQDIAPREPLPAWVPAFAGMSGS